MISGRISQFDDIDGLKNFLDYWSDKFNNASFINEDPISVPHAYHKKEDIEIAAFFSALFSWGLRKTIISKAKELMLLFDNDPHSFVLHHSEKDLSMLMNFVHRTFQSTDLLYTIDFLKRVYTQHKSLEAVFLSNDNQKIDAKESLTLFHMRFFDAEYAPARTKKHISTPVNGSTCKRLNMFLRWMVRKDKKGVDFGIWSNIPMEKLMIPLDVHVERISRNLGLITKPTLNWNTVEELTANLRKLDERDPIKYDFALFGLGAIEKFSI